MTAPEAERLALIKYPRYDWPRVDPATGKPDCRLTKLMKDQARAAYMLKLLKNAPTEKAADTHQ